MKPLRTTLLVTASAALGAATLASPALAQSGARSGEIVFVDLGRWTIYEATSAGYCEMRLRSGLNGSLSLRKRAGAPGSLRVSLANANRFFGPEITFAFDDAQFGGVLRDGRVYAPSSDSSAIESEFRKAETLSILQGGATVASISLKSSSAGFRLLNQCAQQWRTSFIPPRNTRVASANPRGSTQLNAPSRPRTIAAPPSPPAAQSQPTVRRGPFPPNRNVTPISPSSWIRGEDFRRLPSLRGDGKLTYSLLVNEEGRVEECSVLKSTGSRRLDGRVCRSLQQRARFEPATDKNGNAVESTFSSVVEFAQPE